MSTFFNFQPNNVGPFQFQPTLDGSQYTAIVPWNMSGARYYISLYTLSQVRLFTLPLIGSTDGMTIEAMSWAHGFVSVQTLRNHGYLMGSTIDLVIEGCVPVEYNGTFRALITGLDKFQYPLAGNPGQASLLGRSSYDINIAAGYFTTSKLVFRESNQVFEVSP